MKIIVVGCGKVGVKIIDRLCKEGEHDITVIDLQYSKVEQTISEYDVMGIAGNSINTDTLLEAGIETADLLIAVTGSDEYNLLTCLTAKKLGNCQTIPRVRNPEYKKTFLTFKEDLNLAMVINPEHAAAREIARALRFPSAIDIDTFAKSRVEILSFKIASESPLVGMKVQDIVAKLKANILVCGVERGNKAFIPGGNFELLEGDLVSIIAPMSEEVDFFKKIGIKTNRVKDTMIVGGGTTSYYLAKQLLMDGIKVKMIEQDIKRCETLCQLLPKATIICGDETDKNTLLEEGLGQMESFVSLTNIDEENILLSLYAKSVTNGKIVTKINRINYDDVVTKLELGTVVYPKDIAAENIIRYVRAMNNSLTSNIETMHLILNDKAEALEFRINQDSEISNKKIEDLKLKKNIIIACITRDNNVIIPRGNDMIMQDDTVIIITEKLGFTDISDILE